VFYLFPVKLKTAAIFINYLSSVLNLSTIFLSNMSTLSDCRTLCRVVEDTWKKTRANIEFYVFTPCNCFVTEHCIYLQITALSQKTAYTPDHSFVTENCVYPTPYHSLVTDYCVYPHITALSQNTAYIPYNSFVTEYQNIFSMNV